MATNIEIASELNKLLSEQLKIVEEQNIALKEQTKLSAAILESFSKVKKARPSESVENLNQSMKEASTTAGSFSDAFAKGLSTIAKRTYVADKGIKNFSIKLDKLLKTPMKIIVLEEALRGLGEGIAFSNSILGSLIQTTSMAAKSLLNLGISIITLPFKILNTLMAEAASISGVELAQAIEDVRKQFGDLTKNEGKAVIKSFRTMGGELSNTGLSVRRVLGNFAERLKFLRETAEGMGRAFNRFTQEFAAHGEEIAAYVKGLGLAAEQIKGVADFATSSGQTMIETGRQITTMAYGLGEAFGINGKLVSRDIADMMKDFKNFGTLGVKQMSQISVFTHKLGIELKDLLGVIDKFDNFEGAAESAAQLSQAFGLQLDTLDLMFDQDPASRFEKLRKSFLATGKTVESLTRQEKALLASQTGISEAALQVGFSQSNMGMSYEEVQKQAGLTEKKQLSQAEAMDKLSNSIERMVKEGQQMKGGFFDIFLQGFFKGIMWTKEWRTMLLNLRKAMRQIYLAGTEVGQMFVKMFPGVKDIFDGIGDLFSPKKWQGLRKGIVDIFRQFFTDLTGTGSKFSLTNLIDRLKTLFGNFADINSPTGKKIVEGFKKFFKTVSGLTAEFAKMAMEGLKDAIKNFTAFIANPSKFMADAKGGSSGLVKFVLELLEPVMEAVKEAWPALKDALIGLGQVAFKKFVEFAKEHWSTGLMGIAAYILPVFAASMTRAIGMSILASASKAVLGWALPKLGGVVGKFLGGFGELIQSQTGSGAAAGIMKPVTEAITQLGTAADSTKKLSAGDIAKFGAKLLLMAAALSLGVVAFVYGIIKISGILKESGLDSVEKIMPSLLVLSAAIAGVVGLGLTAKLLDTVPWASLAKTLVVGAVGVAALGGMAIAMAWFFTKVNNQLSGITASEAAKTIGILMSMTTSLAALALLIVGVGAVILNPVLGAMALAGVAGLAALGVIAMAVVATAKSIIKEISSLTLGPQFGEKLKAFSTVISSLTGFARVFVDLMSEAKPSFFSLESLMGKKGESVEKTLGPLKNILGAMTSSIKDIFKIVTTSITGLQGGVDPASLNSFVSLFGSVINMAANLQSQSMNKIMDKLSDNSANPEAIKKLTEKVSGHVWAVAGAIQKIVPLMSETFATIGNLKMDKGQLQTIEAFGSFIQNFSGLATLLQGDQVKIDSPGEKMLTFMGGLQTTMISVAAMAADLKSSYITQAAGSIKEMVDLINNIQNDLKSISKSGDLKPLNVQLKQTADKLGLAGTNEIKVKMDEINFHIHVDVKISTDELEKSLIEKPNAKIVTRK